MRLLLLFFIFLSVSTFATELSVTIKWDDFNGVSLPSFLGANYDDSMPAIPFWSTNIECIDKDEIPVIEITECKNLAASDLFDNNIESDTFNISFQNVCSRNEEFTRVLIIPFRRYNDSIQLITKFKINYVEKRDSKKGVIKNTFINNSVLATGSWVKVKTLQKGIHKITYENLMDMGFQNPDIVNVYGNGGFLLSKMNNDSLVDDLYQNVVWRSIDGNGKNCLFFYASGRVNWNYNTANKKYEHEINNYSGEECYYFLSDNYTPESEIELAQVIDEQPDVIVNEYDNYRFFEEEKINLLKSGRLWLGDVFSGGESQYFEFDFALRVPEEPVTVDVSLVGRSSAQFSAEIKINSQSSGEFQFEPYHTSESSEYADSRSGTFEYVGEDDKLEVELQNNGSSTSRTWLNYIRLNARCRLSISGSQFCFRDSRTVGVGNITGFEISNASSGFRVWDVTNHLALKNMSVSFSGEKISFVAETGTLREFVVFDPSGDLPTVEVVGDIENQNIHATGGVEMLIITHPEFQKEANRLAQFHRNSDGMQVAVVYTSQIFNEFSSGISDVAAIRNYVRMCYSRSEGALKYLLLFGNGTYDNVNDISESNPNFVPTWQSEESLIPASSFVSDDFYGLLDENEGEYIGAVDIGVGRIPCVNKAEAVVAVDKIVHYNSPESIGEWRNVLCFIGDDEDGNIHVRDAEKLTEKIVLEYPEFVVKKIYFDAYFQESSPNESYPGVTDAINEQIKQGALIVNYTGHANDDVLAHERVLTKDDIDLWTNYDRLPVFVTATCEFSRWDYCEKRSAGEHVLFNKHGGGIALFSTTRLVYSSSNYNINRKFFDNVFEDDEAGENLRLGDIIRLAKIESGGGVNSRKFALLGDPALALNYPQYNVKTTYINDVAANLFGDTIRALETIEIIGEVQDNNGDKLEQFSGDLFAVVNDKSTIESTLGNDGVPFEYVGRGNTIFIGNVTVENGDFSLSFIVPKDIDYSVGAGEIRYYANNLNEDAHGYHSFQMGGSSDNSIFDSDGPEIELFLENENFISGDRTHENPLMIAYVSDVTGINTTSAGIGHDVTLVINNNEEQSLILNDFFRYDTDSYKEGKIYYQLSEIPEGEHSLRLKVWDVLNNSSFAEIEFVVVSELTLDNLVNFPNPMKEETYFSFEHNRYDELLNVRIEIFDLNGRVLDIIETTAFSNGNVIEPILWNPIDRGILLRNGIYIYSVSVTTDGGLTLRRGERLLILK